MGVERPTPEMGAHIPQEEKDEIQGKESRFRKCSKGNIRFIGELFKRSLLSERIMHRVIKKLLLETDHSDPKNQVSTSPPLGLASPLAPDLPLNRITLFPPAHTTNQPTPPPPP